MPTRRKKAGVGGVKSLSFDGLVITVCHPLDGPHLNRLQSCTHGINGSNGCHGNIAEKQPEEEDPFLLSFSFSN